MVLVVVVLAVLLVEDGPTVSAGGGFIQARPMPANRAGRRVAKAEQPSVQSVRESHSQPCQPLCHCS